MVLAHHSMGPYDTSRHATLPSAPCRACEAPQWCVTYASDMRRYRCGMPWCSCVDLPALQSCGASDWHSMQPASLHSQFMSRTW